MSTAPVTTNGRNGIARKAQLAAVHLVFGTRRWTERQVAEFARGLHGKRVLEIGSGPPDPDEKYLAWTKLFDSSNDFVQSDVDAEYGHRVVDVTTMEIENEFSTSWSTYTRSRRHAGGCIAPCSLEGRRSLPCLISTRITTSPETSGASRNIRCGACWSRSSRSRSGRAARAACLRP
jgi:hypothetical protein